MGRPKKVRNPVVMRTFEECLGEIEVCIAKRRHRWLLSAISFLDWSDVAQNLRVHIWKKWHLYDQTRPLSSWLITVINNQMFNMIRNYYGNFSRPCLKCEFYEGDNLCSKFGEVTVKCELYRNWVHGKKTKHDIHLPLAMENHKNEVHEIKSENLDIDRNAENIHEKMRKILKPMDLYVYELSFVQHKSDEEIGKLLKFKSQEKNRQPGYKQISNIKKRIIKIVKENLNSGEIEII